VWKYLSDVSVHFFGFVSCLGAHRGGASKLLEGSSFFSSLFYSVKHPWSGERKYLVKLIEFLSFLHRLWVSALLALSISQCFFFNDSASARPSIHPILLLYLSFLYISIIDERENIRL
jgi:hypothetical protein